MANSHKPRAGGKHADAPNRSFTRVWGIRALLLAGFVAFCQYANSINHRFYSLSPQTLNASVQAALVTAAASGLSGGANSSLIISTVLSKLVEDHPEASFNTNFEDKSEWVFNNAAGAMGSMFIIHASITEYLIIFGTAVGTEGHTGRHTADDYFHILVGQQTAYEAGDLVKEVYNAGDVHHLKRGVVKQYTLAPDSWALEYAQGWIPLMLPMGFADSLFSTLDLITLYHTTRITGREMIKNLLKGKI
ncbi:C-8 sterol isomerase, partial [Tremellales sp. Uapishka_1]